MRYVLSRFDHPDKDDDVVGRPDPLIACSSASILKLDKARPIPTSAGR